MSNLPSSSLDFTLFDFSPFLDIPNMFERVRQAKGEDGTKKVEITPGFQKKVEYFDERGLLYRTVTSFHEEDPSKEVEKQQLEEDLNEAISNKDYESASKLIKKLKD